MALHRAETLLDQWRRKATMFGHDVLLHLHGDDFRYESASEWKAQTGNLTLLANYINNHPEMKTKVQFLLSRNFFSCILCITGLHFFVFRYPSRRLVNTFLELAAS